MFRFKRFDCYIYCSHRSVFDDASLRSWVCFDGAVGHFPGTMPCVILDVPAVEGIASSTVLKGMDWSGVIVVNDSTVLVSIGRSVFCIFVLSEGLVEYWTDTVVGPFVVLSV